MRFFEVAGILLILLSYFTSLGRVFASEIAAPMVVFGDVRGNFEPCGCDPRTDIGGVVRLAATIERYRLSVPNLLVVSTGNIVANSEADLGKMTALLDSMNVINPNVILLNNLDAELFANRSSPSQLKWLSTNYEGSKLGFTVPKHVVINHHEFFGYTKYAKGVRSLGIKEVISYVKKTSKLKDGSKRTLLFSGSEDELKELAATRLFGTIVSSNTTPLGVKKGDEERANEKNLVRNLSNEEFVWMVPYGAAGILRAGGLETQPFPKTLAESLTPKSGLSGQNASIFGAPQNTGLPLATPIHWLTLNEETQIPEKISHIVKKYRDSSADRFVEFVKLREVQFKTTKFAGAEACASCHKKAYDVWASSAHARAIATLTNKNRHEDLSCVTCHVVGFHVEGGFAGHKTKPSLANVQCESCHGPSKEHQENPAIKPKLKGFDTCAECHTPPHSPGFDKKSYWEKIRH